MAGTGAAPPILVVGRAATGAAGRPGAWESGIVLLPTGAVGGGAGAVGAAAEGAGAVGRGTPGTAGRGAPASGTVGAPGRGGATGGRGATGAAAASASASPEAAGAWGLSVMRTVSFFSGAAGGLMGGRGGPGTGAGLGFSGSCIGNLSSAEILATNGSFAAGCQHRVAQKAEDSTGFSRSTPCCARAPSPGMRKKTRCLHFGSTDSTVCAPTPAPAVPPPSPWEKL